MENASKALIMAAGVLIGVLILSLAVYLFSSLGAQANENYDLMREEEIAQFNSFYLAYKGRNDLTYYDIWNVVNKAKETNEKYDETGIKVEVYVKFESGGEHERTSPTLSSYEIKITTIDQLMAEIPGSEKLKEYKCNKIEINNSTGRVEKIYFQE